MKLSPLAKGAITLVAIVSLFIMLLMLFYIVGVLAYVCNIHFFEFYVEPLKQISFWIIATRGLMYTVVLIVIGFFLTSIFKGVYDAMWNKDLTDRNKDLTDRL